MAGMGFRGEDMTGRVYGGLTVLERVRGINAPWLCRCECGSLCRVAAAEMRDRNQRSCGCRRRARTIDRNTSHGRSRTTEHIIWVSMKARCYNPKNKCYLDYGGRGITVCDEWRNSFEAFFAAIGSRPSPQHSLDRTNNDWGYFPGNVRWATKKEQVHNRRSKERIAHDRLNYLHSEAM